MPRFHKIITDFSTGEVSPRASKRVDIAKYNSACEEIENWLLLPLGGLTRRPGLRFIDAAKYPDRKACLVPFEFSTIQAYMLEFGHLYIRFYRNGALITDGVNPIEVATPYTEDEVFALKFAPSADTLSIAHRNHAPRELLRFAHTSWVLRPITFIPMPSREYGARPQATLTLSATTGTGVTATASAAAFEASDVGRTIVSGAGEATITGYTSQTVVTVDVTQDFLGLTAALGTWHLTASPRTTCTPTAKSPVGAACTLTLGVAGFRNHTGDTDIGKMVILNGGSVEITAFIGATQVSGLIRGELNATTAAPSGAWSLEEPAWSTLNGFPGAVAYLDDRLYWASSAEQPVTFWGSKAGDFHNHGIGALDDDAVVFTLKGANTIGWLQATKLLVAGAGKEEWLLTGGTDQPITPSNVTARADTTYGSKAIQPVRIGNVTPFVSRSGKALREHVFSFEVDGYVAPNLLLLAEHLTRASPITQLAYQAEPDSIIWAVRADGVLLACTYLRDQNIVAWTRQITQGQIESVAVTPHPSGQKDQVWVLVNRTINGATRRYIEVLDDDGLVYDRLHTDSALTYSGAPATAISGLEHLENMTVAVIGDGAVYADAVVSAGQITIDPPASKVEVGLAYISDFLPVEPEVPSGAGTSLAVPKRWNDVQIELLDTLGLEVGGTQQIPFRRVSDPMDGPPPLFTGKKTITQVGWDKKAQIRIRQVNPLPATVVAITGTLDLGG